MSDTDRLVQLFAGWAGEPCAEVLALSGESASSRRYFRLRGATRCCVGTVATDLRENEAFFSFGSHLHSKGLPVPEIYAVDADRRHYLQEDLGDTSLYTILLDKRRAGRGFDADMHALYSRALADLDAIQKGGRDADFAVGFPRPAFDRRAILWDLNYFKYHFLKLADIPFDEDRLQDDFERFTDSLLEADCTYFMYRDFNPRNIMVTEQAGEPQLRYIDFQGGRRGAAQYDVASLLYSAKSDLPQALRNELLQHYVSLHGDPHFMDHFWHYVLLRILQTLGAYGYRGIFERKPYFIESIPLAHNNLRHLVEDHPDLLADLPELQSIVGNLELVVKSDDSGDRSHGAGVENATTPNSQLSTLNSQLTVSVMSFSYKQGLPEDPSGNGGGHVFDCRALPNPGRYPEYKAYTGKDAPVIEFLRDKQPVATFLDHALAIVSQSVDKYLERHFTHLSVSFGCTGGQHRSVYCAEQLAKTLRSRYPDVEIVVKHREQQHAGCQ